MTQITSPMQSSDSNLAGQGKYSRENAVQFAWSSVTGNLNSDRVATLKKEIRGHRILDAGCGGGAYVDYLSRQGYDVTGVDVHGTFLDVARECRYMGKFVTADLTDRLPFADKAFDSTYCFDVLEHVDDCSALQELARVTRNVIIFTVPHEDLELLKYGITLPTYKDQTHLRYYTFSAVESLVNVVSPGSYYVAGEIEIPLIRLARDRISVRSRYAFLTPIYERMFKFLLARSHVENLHLNVLAVLTLE